jgi:hypothetical protein
MIGVGCMFVLIAGPIFHEGCAVGWIAMSVAGPNFQEGTDDVFTVVVLETVVVFFGGTGLTTSSVSCFLPEIPRSNK